jgi:hypothetical protein
MQQYRLKQSSTLNLLTTGLYCLVLVTINIFLHETIFLAASLTLLTLLLLIRAQSRYQRLRLQDPTIVSLSSSTARVDLSYQGEHFRYEQFRVFSNRWFLILQMRNQHTSQNLMLVSDRFNSFNEYLNFRYLVGKMSRIQHVT